MLYNKGVLFKGNRMKQKIWPDAVATVFGVGKVPKAPGTFGTLAAAPFVFLLMYLDPFVYMGLTVIGIVAAIFAAELYGKGQDLKEIVADEFVGFMVAMFLVPNIWQFWIIGFLAFRFLDILKPFPISHFDKNIKGGFGVVLDDLVAGLIVNILIHFILIPYIGEFIGFHG